MKFRCPPLRALILATFASLLAAGAAAQGGLTRLKGPMGGEVVYGPVTQVANVPQAMGAVLRMLHQSLGARPEVGRVVEVNGTGTATLRFMVNPPQGSPLGGMIIVAQGAQGYEAGVVFDQSDRLRSSFNPMLQALAGAWHPEPAAAGGPQASPMPPARLYPLTLSDNSARVALPGAWRVTPDSSGGTIIANGPNGELAALAAPYLVLDNGTPEGRARQRQGASMRGTIYANGLYYPYGQDPGRTFADLYRMMGERMHATMSPLRIENQVGLADRNGMRCTRLQGEGGLEANRGPSRFDTVFCVAPPVSGSWTALAYHVAAPAAAFDAEQSTLLAVRDSFEPNQRVIAEQAARIAAPVIAQIHEIGRQATLRAAEADRVRIDMRNRFEAYGNTRDRLAQGFTNYQRDQSVIVDNDTGAQATTWNSVADSMVKNNPQRYGIVDTPGYWKGVDY